MGEELKEKLGAEIELIAGSNGVYDVVVDGSMIFSKFEEGRFPETGEIVDLVTGAA